MTGIARISEYSEEVRRKSRPRDGIIVKNRASIVNWLVLAVRCTICVVDVIVCLHCSLKWWPLYMLKTEELSRRVKQHARLAFAT